MLATRFRFQAVFAHIHQFVKGCEPHRKCRLPFSWCRRVAAIALFICLASVFFSSSARGQSAPALSVALTGTNEVTLTVTNGTSTAIYEIYWTEFLNANATAFTNGAWNLVYSGTTGQTNFVLDLGDTVTGFFRAVNGNDFDNDGVLNNQDARPFDPLVGILQVTIEIPANGAQVD